MWSDWGWDFPTSVKVRLILLRHEYSLHSTKFLVIKIHIFYTQHDATHIHKPKPKCFFLFYHEYGSFKTIFSHFKLQCKYRNHYYYLTSDIQICQPDYLPCLQRSHTSLIIGPYVLISPYTH